MEATNIRAWTDISPDTRFRNMAPNVIITKDMIDNGEYDSLLGDEFLGGAEREVIYDDGTTKRQMTLTLYVHPTGAGALVINPTVVVATNHNGRLLGEDGAYVGDAEPVGAIAGALLSNYCETSSFVGSGGSTVPVWSTSLAEGDAIWLVRSGDYDLKMGTTGITPGSRIVSDISSGASTPSGCARGSTTSFGSLAQIQEQITGYGGTCIGLYESSNGATNSVANVLNRCKLALPKRMFR